jgi:hypothetical protein
MKTKVYNNYTATSERYQPLEESFERKHFVSNELKEEELEEFIEFLESELDLKESHEIKYDIHKEDNEKHIHIYVDTLKADKVKIHNNTIYSILNRYLKKPQIKNDMDILYNNDKSAFDIDTSTEKELLNINENDFDWVAKSGEVNEGFSHKQKLGGAVNSKLILGGKTDAKKQVAKYEFSLKFKNDDGVSEVAKEINDFKEAMIENIISKTELKSVDEKALAFKSELTANNEITISFNNLFSDGKKVVSVAQTYLEPKIEMFFEDLLESKNISANFRAKSKKQEKIKEEKEHNKAVAKKEKEISKEVKTELGESTVSSAANLDLTDLEMSPALKNALAEYEKQNALHKANQSLKTKIAEEQLEKEQVEKENAIVKNANQELNKSLTNKEAELEKLEKLKKQELQDLTKALNSEKEAKLQEQEQKLQEQHKQETEAELQELESALTQKKEAELQELEQELKEEYKEEKQLLKTELREEYKEEKEELKAELKDEYKTELQDLKDEANKRMAELQAKLEEAVEYAKSLEEQGSGNGQANKKDNSHSPD